MVDETTTAAKEISIATQQQRSASEQVVSAMGQVADVSRQYAVGSKQAAAAATELNTLAADLRASIAQFKTHARRPCRSAEGRHAGPAPDLIGAVPAIGLQPASGTTDDLPEPVRLSLMEET